MLTFFRKHQKLFFGIVAVVTIFSFSFFGTFTTFTQPTAHEDRKVGETVDGSSLMESELVGMVHLLSRGDLRLGERFLVEECVEQGIVQELGRRYFSEVKDELQERFSRIGSYVFYIHPHAPFIRYEEVASRLFPTLAAVRKSAKAGAAPEELELYLKLFAEQAAIPPAALRQMLLYHESRFPSLPRDPLLQQRNLALFGFEGAEEWLGPRYMQMIARFLINTSQLAEKWGYRVSMDEVKRELHQRIPRGDAPSLLMEEAYAVGLPEGEYMRLWKKLLLVEKLFHDLDHALPLAKLEKEAFNSFAVSQVSIETYELPEALQLNDPLSLFKFQVYVQALGVRAQSTALPLKPPAAENVAKSRPEFVAKRLELEWRSLSLDEFSRSLPLKEIWEWQSSDAGWKELLRAFPVLGKAEAGEARMARLDSLSPRERHEVDKAARLKMAQGREPLLKESLSKKEWKQGEVVVRLQGGSLPFPAEIGRRELLERLESEKEVEIMGKEALVHVRVKKEAGALEILPFQTLLADGTLDTLLDKELQESYSKMGRKEPLKEIRELVGKSHFAELLSSMKGGRLLPYVRSVREEVARGEKGSIQTVGTPYLDQWKLKVKPMKVAMNPQLLNLQEGELSQVEDGKLFFLRKLQEEETPTDLSNAVWRRAVVSALTEKLTQDLDPFLHGPDRSN